MERESDPPPKKSATKTRPLPFWLFYRVETSRVCVAAALRWGKDYFPKCRHAAAISECLDGPSRCVSGGAGITGRGNTGLQHGAWLKVKDALWHKAALGMRKLAFKIKEGLEAMDGWMDWVAHADAISPHPPISSPTWHCGR